MENKIEIEITEDIAEGIYANLAVITHSSSEFVADFIRIMPGTPKSKVKSRIILTPENAKRLLLALEDNISGYERNFGKIKIAEESAVPMPPIIGNGGMA